MKKIISITLLLMMVLSMNVSANDMFHMPFTDVFNNPVFEIIAVKAEEPAEPAPDAEVIFERITWDDERSTDEESMFINLKYYSDGNYTCEDLFLIDAYTVEKATSRFPAYLKGDTEGKYVAYAVGGATAYGVDNTDVYLVDATGDEITKKLILSFNLEYDRELRTSIYTLFNVEEKDGEVIRTPMNEGPLTWEEVRALEMGTEYNDGITTGIVYEDEYSKFTGYKDINGNVYFEDLGFSYFTYMYNLGYLVTVSNNGGALDYSLENCEDYRVYTSIIENVFTGEEYAFNDTDISAVYDSGYLEVYVKDETRKKTGYIAKLKKHAVLKVMVNGEKVRFDVLPTSQNGRTLVPLRAIFEALGAEIEWDGETQTITATKDDLAVSLKIGSNSMTVNDQVKELEVPAQSIDGRTLVPVRAISEAFGCDVQWDGAKNAVVITY